MGNRVRGSPPDPGGPAAGLPASARARAPRPACVFAHAHCRRRGRFLSVPRSPLAPLRRLRPPSGDGPGARGAGRRPAGPAPGGRAAVRPGLTRAEARARPRSRRPGPRGRAAAAAAQGGGTRARPECSAAARPGRAGQRGPGSSVLLGEVVPQARGASAEQRPRRRRGGDPARDAQERPPRAAREPGGGSARRGGVGRAWRASGSCGSSRPRSAPGGTGPGPTTRECATRRV